MSSVQQSLELILARNLVENISVPALVLDANGVLAFFNQSAAAIIGSRFEETGPLSEEEWRFELSRGGQGEHTPWSADSIPLALREGRPAHERFHLRGRDVNDQLTPYFAGFKLRYFPSIPRCLSTQAPNVSGQHGTARYLRSVNEPLPCKNTGGRYWV